MQYILIALNIMVLFISHCANNYKTCINLLNSYNHRLQIDLNHDPPHKLITSVLTAANMARSLTKPVLLLTILFIVIKLIESKPYYYGNVNNPGAVVFEEPTNLFDTHTLTPNESEDYFGGLIDEKFSNAYEDNKNVSSTPAAQT